MRHTFDEPLDSEPVCRKCGHTIYDAEAQCAGEQPAPPSEDRRRTVYLFFEAAVRGWKDEPANRYADLDWNEIIFRTATSYADAMLKAR